MLLGVEIILPRILYFSYYFYSSLSPKRHRLLALKGKGSKTPVMENVRDEKSVENWPKNCVFRQKTQFSAKKFQAAFRDGGGTPLFR